MQPDYKVRYLHDDVISAAATACWKAAPPDRVYIFDVIKLIEILVTSGIDRIFHIKGDREKGHLEVEFFERGRKWWEKPAWVTFRKKGQIDRGSSYMGGGENRRCIRLLCLGT
jgi:hypothetical protein